MTKVKVYSADGKVKEELDTSCFSSVIRPDISQKVYETSKEQQPFAPYLFAGKLASASGKIKRARKVWKTGYGHGISRVPRKIFWRRGNQFYWQAAVVASTVGGRRAHPPRVEHFLSEKRINKKEGVIALKSCIAATANSNWFKKRNNIEAENIPIILESEVLKLETKKFFEALKNILKNLYAISLKTNRKRAGKGKMRGNKYRKSAGLLLVIGKEEKCSLQGIDIRKTNELEVRDIYPLGRLTLYTKNAVKELEKLGTKK